MKTTSSRSSYVGRVCVIAALCLAGCGGGGSNDAANGNGANGSGNASSGGETAQSGGAAEPTFPMPLPNFLGAVTAEVLPDLCSDASPLRTCYPSIDAQVCATAFTTAMMSCGENMQSSLPAEVTEETADPVATAVATCARMAYQGGLEQAGAARAADCPLAR